MNPYMVSPSVMDGGEWIFVQFPVGYGSARKDVMASFPDATFDGEMQAFLIPNTKTNRKRVKARWANLRVVKSLEVRVGRRIVDKNTILAHKSELAKREVTAVSNMPHGLYEFQKEGVRFLAQRGCAILADEMGLGKTVQSISAAGALVPRGRRLVVVPATLVENWVDEIEKWAPDDDASIYYLMPGTARDKRIATIHEFAQDPNGWLVVSWEAVRLHATPMQKGKKQVTDTELAKLEFDVVIADEAHRMKNRKTLQSMAIKRIASPYKFALTGTPIMNRPDELWSILNWLEPKNFTSYWNFFDDFVDYAEGYFGKQILGSKNEKQLGRLLAPRMIRRMKREIGDLDIPPRMPDRVVHVELSPAQKKAYDEMVEYFLTQLEDGEIVVATQVIAQVMRLKQICISLALLSEDVPHSAKIDTLMDMVEDAGNQKLVVFSQFAKAIVLIHERLKKAKVPHIVLTGQHSIIVEADGSTRKTSRGELVKAFQRAKSPYMVFLSTTQAGGVGITLTASSTPILLDEMWTPADNEQAIARVDRIGQKSTVTPIIFRTRGTIEDHIAQSLGAKSAMIQEILGWATKIQKDDIDTPIDQRAARNIARLMRRSV